jgi:hypothetical protein
VNEIAEQYVKLVLALGQHDADYVDAYYGPADWKTAAERTKQDLNSIGAKAAELSAELSREPQPDDEMAALRLHYLQRQLAAVAARVRMLKGERLSFDEESRALYDAVAPTLPASHFQHILDTLEKRFPGKGPLVERYDAWKRAFIIPREKLDTVFQLAIRAGRERTLNHVALPPDEQFTVEYVTNKSWSGYNWYQGGFKSLIQVNTDLPVYIDRAVDLACHEGYPGHHVYNVLLEKNLVKDRGWIEFTVYPLFSPQARRTSVSRSHSPARIAWNSSARCSSPPPGSTPRARRSTTRHRGSSTSSRMRATRPPGVTSTRRSMPRRRLPGSSSTR